MGSRQNELNIMSNITCFAMFISACADRLHRADCGAFYRTLLIMFCTLVVTFID